MAVPEKNMVPPDMNKCWRMLVDALAEDVGKGDITTLLTIPSETKAVMHFTCREELVVCGSFIAQMAYHYLNPHIEIICKAQEGDRLEAGDVIVIASGPAQALLTGERVVLNFMQHLSGIATQTSRFVEAVKGTKALILDTRKTTPGWRDLEKYAVRAGGGNNHRMRLDEAAMIKDNHIAVCGGITAAVGKIRAQTHIPLIVECDSLAQVEEAIALKPERILLDNMDRDSIAKAVALAAGRVPLEVSGGVTLEKAAELAKTGVDYISVGGLTHSVKAADIGADIAFD